MKSLFAKLEEFDLPSEVLSDRQLDLLRYRGLVDVPVDL